MHDPNEIPALEPNGSRLAFSQEGQNDRPQHEYGIK